MIALDRFRALQPQPPLATVVLVGAAAAATTVAASAAFSPRRQNKAAAACQRAHRCADGRRCFAFAFAFALANLRFAALATSCGLCVSPAMIDNCKTLRSH